MHFYKGSMNDALRVYTLYLYDRSFFLRKHKHLGVVVHMGIILDVVVICKECVSDFEQQEQL